MFKVKFVAHSNTKQGSTSIRVVGNLPQLGNWNPYNGFQMEEYYDGEWQSIKHLEIPNGQQFQFKLVKLNDKNGVQWQEMPNNSNRKFKPKFHTKLILKWSNHIGKVLNQAKSSLKFKGLPGVMMHGKKQAGMLKRNPKNRHILSDSDSQQQNQNDSFCVGRKKSTDIRQSINSDDIQQIYYDTTDLQKAYQHYKQTQVHLISSCADLHKQFITKIEQQLKQLHELQNFKFKWLLLTNDQANLIKFKKTSFKKIQKYNDDKIYLDQYNLHTNQKNHFIFVDLDAALRAVVGNASACLYLSSVEFQKVIKFLNQLEQFQFICFDNQDKNKELLKLFQEKRSQTQINQFQTQKQKQNSIQNMLKQNLLKKQEQSKSQKNFTTATMSIQKILQQLQFCHHSESSVNTVHSFTKKQSLANILQANSILIIDSQLMKIDKKYFDSLLDTQFEKRFIMIIHKIGIPQWIHLYSEHKNICVILDNYTKFYFVGKMYDPSKKHREAIDFIKMRAKLFEKQVGGQWRIQQNSFTFYFKPGTTTKAHNIKSQIQNVLMKDYDYFKFYIKQNRLKIVWNLSHTVRLFRTLVRIKSMQQGQIGNFFIVSVNQNFNQIKQQLKLLINTNSNLMLDGKNTRIFYYGFGSQSNAKYSIKNQNITNQSTSSTSSSLSTLSEIGIEKQKVKKFVQIQQKYSENKKQTTQI